MGMAISLPKYTVDDLEQFPEDGNRYELLDGMLLVTPAPTNAHQIIANRLQVRLSNVARARRAHRGAWRHRAPAQDTTAAGRAGVSVTLLTTARVEK